jgi:hypothetical protein
VLPQRARNRPVETTTYRVHARLVESKFKDDSDFHLVIADPRTGGTMIVEFPASYCTLTANPVLRRRMQAARLAFIRPCGVPSSSYFTRLRGTAWITGVGFFDRNHGQTGRAPNLIAVSSMRLCVGRSRRRKSHGESPREVVLSAAAPGEHRRARHRCEHTRAAPTTARRFIADHPFL